MSSPSPALGPWRARLLAAVLLIFVLELMALLGLSVLYRRLATPSFLQAERDAIIAGAETSPALETFENLSSDMRAGQVLHPYLGFVADPEAAPASTETPFSPTSTDFGFPRNRADLFAEPEPDELTVAVFGGSVAYILATHNQQLFADRLAQTWRFKHKKLRVLNFALPGYKQPQQLMALAYALSLGVKIDIVVNVDGFNEVALPYEENLKDGVFPFYPRSWRYRVSQLDPHILNARGLSVHLQKRRAQRATFFSRPPWRFSFTSAALWKLLDLQLARQLTAAQTIPLSEPSSLNAYQTRGPTTSYPSDAAMYESFATLWQRSSEAMHALCSSLGIEYHHFLQPNQYVAGSKPLSESEQQIAWREDHRYRRGVVEGYPLLIQYGQKLRENNISFSDLTQIFADVEETLYIDDCCHFNIKGNAIMAKTIATILTRYRASGRVSAAKAGASENRQQP